MTDQTKPPAGLAMTQPRFCCDALERHAASRCTKHPDRFDCPDALIAWMPTHGYGMIVHDGGRSMIAISFCPWCGTSLPTTPEPAG